LVDPETGRTLCGDAARRYIRRLTERQERGQRRLYGLTPTKEREARRIIAADTTLQALLRGRQYRVGDLGPWTLEGSVKSIGVLAEIEMSSPITATAVLPFVCSRRDPSRGSGRSGVKMRDVTLLHVLVHFATARVAEIIPTSRPGAPRPKIAPTPLPGAAGCPPSGG
jgi:hypothetical protein